MAERKINYKFLDIINYAICETVNDFLDGKELEFFRKVGEYHLTEASERHLLDLVIDDKPLDNLIKVARYLESMGYMEKISIKKLSESEAVIEMSGVSVTDSSVKMLEQGKHPSHYMTNLMQAALRKMNIKAELRDMDYNAETGFFREYWKILD